MRVIVVMLLIASAGCLNFDYDYESDSRYGSFDLEGRAQGASIWADHARLVVAHPDTFTEPDEGDIVPQPGGGQVHTLELPEMDVDVEVRALDASGDLDWYLFRVERNPFVDTDALSFAPGDGQPFTTARANETVTFTVEGPGLWAVIAHGDVGRSDTLYVALDAAWNVEGEVYPQRAQGDPAPADYDDMTDLYVVELPTALPAFRINTSPRDGDALIAGTDIDVGLWAADRTPISCYGDDDASEGYADRIRVTVDEVAFAIGAQPDECGGGYHYDNQGPVAYAATLRTDYAKAI